MKHYKPGQFYSLNDVLYRAKRRTPGAGCRGCILNNIILCPNIGVTEKSLDCTVDDIIFVRV